MEQLDIFEDQPKIDIVEKSATDTKRELNSMYWTDRCHLICCCRRNSLECSKNYSKDCDTYTAIIKEYSEDLYYKYKRMVVLDDNYKEFRKLFKSISVNPARL
jgi:hypothetical protein